MKYINDNNGSENEIPDGAEIFWRPTVYAIILKDDSILMVKPHHGLWALPGGGMESDESVEEAIKREVFEETGCIIKIQELFNTAERYLYHEKDQVYYHVVAMIFTVSTTMEPKEKPLSKTDGEVTEVGWVKLSELNEGNCHFLFLPIIKSLNEF